MHTHKYRLLVKKRNETSSCILIPNNFLMCLIRLEIHKGRDGDWNFIKSEYFQFTNVKRIGVGWRLPGRKFCLMNDKFWKEKRVVVLSTFQRHMCSWMKGEGTFWYVFDRTCRTKSFVSGFFSQRKKTLESVPAADVSTFFLSFKILNCREY